MAPLATSDDVRVTDWNDPPERQGSGPGSDRPWQAPSTPGAGGGEREPAGTWGQPASPQDDHGWQDVPRPPTAATGGDKGFRIQPMTIGDLLDATFKMLKLHWKPLLQIAGVYALPAVVLQLLLVSGSSDSVDVNGGNASGVLTGLVNGLGNDRAADSVGLVVTAGVLSLAFSVLLIPLLQGAITRLVASAYLGEDIDARQALQLAKSRWTTLMAAAVLTFFCVLGGLVLLIIGAFVIAVLLTFVTPVIMVEGGKARRALSRSWSLFNKRFWGYVGALVAMGIVELIIKLVLSALAAIIGTPLLGSHAAGGVVNVLAAAVNLIVSGILATLMYFDARVRNEGFDIQLAMGRQQAASPSWGPAQRIDDVPRAEPQRQEPYRNDPPDPQPPLTR